MNEIIKQATLEYKKLLNSEGIFLPDSEISKQASDLLRLFYVLTEVPES